MLHCRSDEDYEEYEWWWIWNREEPRPLTTRRSRACCSCGAKLTPGDLVLEIERLRATRSVVEARIYGDDGHVPMASWYLCETCSDLAVLLDDLGFCFELGPGAGSLRDQIAEYRSSR